MKNQARGTEKISKSRGEKKKKTTDIKNSNFTLFENKGDASTKRGEE